MRFFRKERIGSVIQKELSELLREEFEFDDALLTVTAVEVSADLQEAVVKISVLPSEKAPRVLELLQKFQPRLQGMLLRKMNIRPMPQIRFEIDHGIERAAEVEKMLLE